MGSGQRSCGSSQRSKVFDVLPVLRVANSAVRRRRPIALDIQAARGKSEAMRGRQPLNITKARRRVVVVQPKQQKIADGRVVKLLGHFRMNSNAIQRIAEQEKISELRVVERPDSKMIPRAK